MSFLLNVCTSLLLMYTHHMSFLPNVCASLLLMYIHDPSSRKDVLSVVKELDSKSLADPIGKMYKRLEKHFASSSEDQVPAFPSPPHIFYTS
jgi:hypothetical protein